MADPTAGKPLDPMKAKAQQGEAVMAAKAAAGVAPAIVPRPVRRYRAVLFQGYVVAATIGFGVLFFYARTLPYFAFDVPVAQWVQSFKPAWFDALMRFV